MLLLIIPLITACTNTLNKNTYLPVTLHYKCESGNKFYIESEMETSPTLQKEDLFYYAKLYGENPVNCKLI